MRIVIADHHPQSRSTLVDFLGEQPDVILLGEAEDSISLVELAIEQSPDVILLEFGLPGPTLLEIIEQIHSLDPAPKVIVMSSDPGDARISLYARAEAYVSKADPPAWLLATLQRYEPTAKSNPSIDHDSAPHSSGLS